MTYIRKTTDLFISKELKSVLTQIEDSSEVAKLLLKTRHNNDSLTDDFVNYLSIAETDKTKISYLTQDRISKIIDNEDLDSLWVSSKRFSTKPGTLIRKVLKNISDKEIEKFSTLFRNVQNKPEFRFEIVEGLDILKWYLFDSYADQSASLGASCMKHRTCQPFLKIYADNPEKVKLLIMLDSNNYLLGRALLWQGDSKIMDRIYTIDDEQFCWYFKNWADKNDFFYKKEQKWNNTLFFESKGKTHFQKMSIQLDNWRYSSYPYLDTFKFLDTKTGTFYNYIPTTASVVTLSTPDGETQDSDFLAFDDKTKLFHHYNDLIWIDYAGVRTHPNNANYSQIYDCYILKEDSSYLEIIRDYIFLDDSKNDPMLIKNYIEFIQEKKQRIKKDYEQIFNSRLTPEQIERTIQDINDYYLSTSEQDLP